MNHFITYAAAILFVIVAFLVIKKVASCLVKSVVAVILLAVLAYLYYFYLR